MNELRDTVMSRNRLFISVVAALVVYAATLWAEGANVEVQLKDGRELEGELYTVRDSSILLLSGGGATPPEFASEIPGISRVETRLIKCVTVGGESTVLESMGIGALIGGGVGALVGAAGGDDPPGFMSMSAGEKAALGSAALGAAGLVVGLVVGIVHSSNKKVVEPLLDVDLSVLKPVSRYPGGVPEQFKRIR